MKSTFVSPYGAALRLFVCCLISGILRALASAQETPSSMTNNTISDDELFNTNSNGLPSISGTQGILRGSLLLYNGRIHTMDPAGTVASVLAIKDGTIVYVGNKQQDALQKGGFTGNQQPKSINLRNRTVIPGLIDCHNHIVLFGNRPGYHTPLENAYNISDVQSTYKARAKDVPPGQFITTIGGFHPNQFTEPRLPTLTELDAATPNHPVFISYGFAGPSVTNTLGRTYFTSPSHKNLTVTIHQPNGSIPTGTETGKALLLLRRHHLTSADRIRSVRTAMAYALTQGVTTHLDQGAFQATDTPSDGAASEDLYTMHDPWLAVYGRGQGTVRLRINFLHLDEDVSNPTLDQRLRNTFPFFGNEMVRTGAIGEFAVSLGNYAGGDNNQVFDSAALKIARKGWRLEVHSLSSSDFRTQIEAFEKVDRQVTIKKLRWVVAHVPHITAPYLARLKALGGGVNLSGWQYLAYTNTSVPAGPPFKTILESGIPAGMGGDGMNIAPMNPFVHMYYAVTGRNSRGEVINPVGETISRMEALRLYTSANAWFLGGEDEGRLGTLEVGRLGDVVVLSGDYFAVGEEEMKRLRSVLTVVGGVVVYDDLDGGGRG